MYTGSTKRYLKIIVIKINKLYYGLQLIYTLSISLSFDLLKLNVRETNLFFDTIIYA